MKQLIVKYRNRIKPTKVNAINNLQWYDPIRKEMQFFEGGQLQFEYQEDSYLVAMDNEEREKLGIKTTFRTLPKVIDLKIRGSHGILDDQDFKKFFKEYLNYNDSNVSIEADRKDIAICNVPNDELDDFSYQLHRQGFDYTVGA